MWSILNLSYIFYGNALLDNVLHKFSCTFVCFPFLQQLRKTSTILQEETREVPDVAPLNPVAGLFTTNIYERINNHPITSLNHTHRHITTVVDLYTNNIAPRFKADTQLAKALFAGFTAAVGQARLQYGESVAGDLPEPITINCVSTNGAE